MTLKTRPAVFLAILFLCLVVGSVSHATSVPEKPLRYVVDLAGIIDDAAENRLNGYLQELEQKTTAQEVILTIPSLEGESIEDFSITIAHDKWKLGQKGKDNGEGVLPDSLVGSLGRDLLVPYFRKGDYSTGIFTAAIAIADKIAKASGVKIEGMPSIRYNTQPSEKGEPAGLFNTIITVAFLIILGILFIKNPRLFLMLLLFSSMGGRRGSWGGGGGFGGGGGGFGGGGGGGFGGGGASGGW
ncbi:MAG: TPM domain-containing protein [Deltaproteobacteria bacterium]|nr:TPM domain-containing protein [Deltaproteobacteria bacterium]